MKKLINCNIDDCKQIIPHKTKSNYKFFQIKRGDYEKVIIPFNSVKSYIPIKNKSMIKFICETYGYSGYKKRFIPFRVVVADDLTR